MDILEPKKAEQPWTFLDLALVVGMAAPSILIAALVGKGVSMLVSAKGLVAMSTQMVLYACILASLFAVLRVKHGVGFWSSLGWKVPWQGMLETAITGPVLALALAFLAFSLRAPQGAMALEELISDRASMVAIGVGAVLMGPIFEELLFRGFAQPLLVRALGLFGGLFVNAVMFALPHGPQYKWSWQHLLVLAIASMVFGLIRYRTGSTAASTLAHAAYNLTFFAALILQGDKIKAS